MYNPAWIHLEIKLSQNRSAGLHWKQKIRSIISYPKISVNYRIRTESPQGLILQKMFVKSSLLVLVAGGGVRAGGCGLGTASTGIGLIGFPWHSMAQEEAAHNEHFGGEKHDDSCFFCIKNPNSSAH